ncbi:hypothetical protein O7626_40335 [Micromonospora sp. WMMD1102]|uniref:hypothetical protein n=1 Tax=Micromonospora sp. WMMD1102 TaxID=3016105 RepID=UPI0024151CE5|nr:hypothetical protein [Micromonospora sp. WMMD1102]MDG4792067.1 hypothetical protein [Micromonospora sp. WMMD1102]
MTATVERPLTVHRNRRRNRRNEFAEQVADRFDRREAVSVIVVDYGPGWWVTAVDRAAGEFEVYRDGGSMTVAWAAVRGD